MAQTLKRLLRLPARISRQLTLLRDDPETFGKNLSQIVNPPLFEKRLLEVDHDGPMHVRYEKQGMSGLRLNVLDTAWTMSGMTGGPNTVINLAGRIARQGVPVRLVATVETPTLDPIAFRQHLSRLLGPGEFPDLPIVFAGEKTNPLTLGSQDFFLATHWRTALQLKAVLPQLPIQQFFYMLQEFEPGFYAWSSNYALALSTYELDFWPIINQSLLAHYLLAQPFGRLSHPTTRERATVFEPAVDGSLFYCARSNDSWNAPSRPRRLLFYARPSNARNMFGLGLMALREAVADPVFDGWEFWAIGSRGSVPDLKLSHGHVLRPAPWTHYAEYGDLLRSADVMLCPMLSPHTSYPVLEMVACGGRSVTNSFATKTAAALRDLSSNIVVVAPTVAGFAEGLRNTAHVVLAEPFCAADFAGPRDWGSTLDPVAVKVAEVMKMLVDSLANR